MVKRVVNGPIKSLGFILIFFLPGILYGEPRNLTFLLWSDTHFGAYDATDTTRLQIIDIMNTIAGKPYPAPLIPEKVGPPAFLMALGDITEHGWAGEWDSPTLAPGRSYLQALKKLSPSIHPYEVLGNHDSRKNNVTRSKVKDRQGNTYYAFDLQGVHFVVLDPYPRFNTPAPDFDEPQLQWLRKDLEKLPAQTPIVLAMHVVPDPAAGDRTSHLSPENSQKLAAILKGKNILALFHGHWHVGSKSAWNGIDLVSPGFSYAAAGCPKGDPTFLVVHITDQKITALEYNWKTNGWGRLYLNKPISNATTQPSR